MIKNSRIYLIYFFFLWGCNSMASSGNDFLPSTNVNQRREKFEDYIKNGYIELGMTKEEVLASWGEPKSIKHEKSGICDEIWVYVPNWKFRNQLFFEGGILVKTEPDYLVVSRMEGHGVMP